MTYAAYACSTSVIQGGELEFRLVPGADPLPPGRSVSIVDIAGDEVRGTFEVDDESLRLPVPHEWPSSLYRADFAPEGGSVWFVVRAAGPAAAARILVSIPFTTWEAYNRRGEPGQSIYWSEQPDRAHRVTFDRPGAEPDPQGWEEDVARWLARTGHDADYCSNIDLHREPALLRGYRLLMCVGHDEYWSWEMRDAVEDFVTGGGNLAILSGNTCWWQIRLEDDGRTMVCYRDPVLDPVAATDPRRVTTEWSSPLINRPENTLTGLGFRRGAGCWTSFAHFAQETYRVAFADHWVFAGTGLRDGDRFGRGAVGYEVDAAELEWVGGVPRATGRDGTPPSFTVLGTADLRHWREYGQGGRTTVGVFELGAGRVFNTGSIGWGPKLGDPVLHRIVDNVVRRFTEPRDDSRWEALGPAPELTAMTASGTRLYGVDADGALHTREICPQNIPWAAVEGEPVPGTVALAAPRETMGGLPQGLYALDRNGEIRYRDAEPEPAPWTGLGTAPAGCTTLAACHEGLYATGAGRLYFTAFEALAKSGADTPWTDIGQAPQVTSLSSVNGRLYALTDDDRVVSRLPSLHPEPWTSLGGAGGSRILAVHAGVLLSYAADRTPRLSSRPAVGPGIAVETLP